MRVLHRKLLRDLWRMRAQALAIGLVIASGLATFVMARSTFDSLQHTQAEFYGGYRFADVFASLKRAPENLAEQIREIPGVQTVETRVVAAVNLDIEGYPDPATALLISYDDERTLLNRVFLRSGRFFDPSRDDEAVVTDAFAEAQNLGPGDYLSAIINGRRKRLHIVGTALSPEFVYQAQPGALVPDFKSYAILWMARKPLATAYDMDGAFNNVSLGLTSAAQPEDVIDRLDAIVRRYGGLGAYARKDQFSHRYLSEEFRQLEMMSTVYPTIFLAVAAFLLNVVFTRLVHTEREQIATLKAFGYGNFAIGAHYLQLAAAIAAIGAVLGVALGVWMGAGLSQMYVEFYRFPFLLYQLQPHVLTESLAISLGAAFVGTILAVVRAARQPPAEAMRPEPPARYRRTLIEKIGLGSWVSEPTRMILRNLQRRPGKALLTAVGIAASYSILVMGLFFKDSIDYMMDVQFNLTQRQDISVTFVEPTSYKAMFELLRMPGVEYAESFRAVPVRLRKGHRTYRTAIQGFEPRGFLNRTLDANLNPVELPPEGLLLTDYLADLLDATAGDEITVEVLEGARPVRQVALAGVVNQFLGLSGYMDAEALNRLMREGRARSGVFLAVDKAYEYEIYRKLKGMPRVAGVGVQTKALASLRDTMAQQILIFAGITTLLAGTITFGVVYNSARISLSERARELASLRVLGFTRGEASYILLGELTILTLLALPLGVVLSRLLCEYFVQTWQTDIFRIPLVLEPQTFSYAAIVVLVCSIVSGLIVRRRIDHLDLVAVLKTRE